MEMINLTLAAQMVKKDLIDLNVDVGDELELFDFIGIITHRKEFTNLGYIASLEKREIAYPTGLKFPKITVALPHVDSKYIKTPFIFVVRNKKMIEVKQMGDGKDLKTQYFFFLGIKKSSEQPKLLAELMQLFQNEKFVNDLLAVYSNEKMYSLLSENLN